MGGQIVGLVLDLEFQVSIGRTQDRDTFLYLKQSTVGRAIRFGVRAYNA